MLWYQEFGWFELSAIAAFVVLYALYLHRVIRIANRLNSPFMAVFVKLSIRTVLFALLIVAVLGPSFGESKKEVKSVGKDIMICVDLSKSMDAVDIAPTRLEKIKYELKKVVAAFNSDRIGIIIFSAEAFMQSPLTYDQNALNLFIETMNTSLVPSGGTDFSPPLRMAIKKLEDNDGKPTDTKSKIIILISDGEDFGDETDEAAAEIENKSIKVFTLGIGTEKGGNIYNGTNLKTDRQGNVVISKLNSSSLQRLASRTGGQYFEINETRNDVSRLINSMNKIEGQFRDARFVDITANKYFYFLALAMLFLVIDIVTSIKTVRI